MKRTFFLILLLSFTFSSSHLFAGNEIITSKTLSIDDVKNYIQYYWSSHSRHFRQVVTSILGVYQEGNSAVVYFHWKHPEGGKGKERASFIRFNSGKWFNTHRKVFLSK